MCNSFIINRFRTISSKKEQVIDGLKVAQNGGRVQLTIVTPIGSKIDPTLTKGVDENGQEITELVSPISNVNRQIVSFAYQIDPDFTVHYRY